VVVHALLVEIPMATAVASSPDPNPSVGEGGLQADLDMAVGADARSLDPKAARIHRRRWRPHGRCTVYGRSSSPLQPMCLATLRSL
jgi:hypothetical protein